MSVGAGGPEQRGQRGGSWSHRLGRTSARPPRLPRRADCFTSLHLIFLQLGMEATSAHGLREDVTASLCASAVVFVSWKSCGEAEGGRGRGDGPRLNCRPHQDSRALP